jgi:hypothetical protein
VFTPVLAKHSKSFNLIDTLAVGVDRIQRNFEPMQRQVEQWRSSQITDERAVRRQALKAPLLVRFPQKCVNPRNVKVSGFPSPRCFRFRTANRPNSIRRVLSGCNSRPNLTSRFRQEPLGVSSVLKTQSKIVGIAHHNYLAACDFLAPGLSPQVEHIMQVHVREQW